MRSLSPIIDRNRHINRRGFMRWPGGTEGVSFLIPHYTTANTYSSELMKLLSTQSPDMKLLALSQFCQQYVLSPAVCRHGYSRDQQVRSKITINIIFTISVSGHDEAYEPPAIGKTSRLCGGETTWSCTGCILRQQHSLLLLRLSI
jgi:hypothetical protein